MMEHKTRELDIHLGLAALILGICIVFAANRINPKQDTVSVKGLCEREMMADRAIYPVSYKESGNDLTALYATVQKKNEAIISFLLSYGFSKEELTVSAPKISDRLADSYGSNYATRYTISSVVSICTDKVEKVVRLQSDIAKLIEQGIAIGSGNEWENPVVYELVKLNDIKPAMIEEANRNARTAAEQFAKDSDSRLGKITSASQGLFSIENRDANTPYIKRVRVVNNVSYSLK